MLYSIDINSLALSISTKKILALSIYDVVTPKAQSVTSGLRVSVQPAKPASPIRFLCEELPIVYVFFCEGLPIVYVFSTHKIFTTFCAPFPDRISHLKTLAIL